MSFAEHPVLDVRNVVKLYGEGETLVRACSTRSQTASGDPAMAFMTSIGWHGRTFRPAYSAAVFLSMIFSKNRYPLFAIML